jgi:hypothetical protein
MPIELPDHAPDPDAEDFDGDRLEALRALTRYACGTGERKDIFLDLAPSADIRAKNRKAWVHQQCPKNAQLGRHDIDNFRRGRADLDFAHGAGKIKLIYYYLFEYLRLDISRHISVIDLVNNVYFPGKCSPAFLAATLYKYLGLVGETISHCSAALSGVYYLYRYGFSEDKTIDVVRSVIAITLAKDEICTRLRFSLVYKGRHGLERPHMDGVILPVRGKLFFAATDNGSPCLLITNEPPTDAHPEFLRGLMLRKNTYDRATASRIVLRRITKPAEEATPKMITSVFQKHESDARILTLDEAKKEIAEFEKFINNRVALERSVILTD